MEVRYVGESDPLKQALLEIYVAVVTKAKFNDFDTHWKIGLTNHSSGWLAATADFRRSTK